MERLSNLHLLMAVRMSYHSYRQEKYDEPIRFLESSIEGAELSSEERNSFLKKLAEYNQRLFAHESSTLLLI